MRIKEYKLKHHSFAFFRSFMPPLGKDTLHGPESHRRFEIIYVVQGEAKYTIEDEQYLVSKGDVIFVMPDELHSLLINRKAEFERILVYFDFDVLRKMFAAAEIEIDDTFFALRRVNRIIPDRLVSKYGIKDTIYDIADIAPEDKNACFRFMSLMFDLIIRLNSSASDQDEAILPISKDPTVKGVIDYVDAHISKPISLDDIAGHLFLSKSALCHRFSRHMKITVNRYVAIKKIHYAEELIRGGMSATEAAIAAGYNHYTTFYHNYKQIMGTSPTASESEKNKKF